MKNLGSKYIMEGKGENKAKDQIKKEKGRDGGKERRTRIYLNIRVHSQHVENPRFSTEHQKEKDTKY